MSQVLTDRFVVVLTIAPYEALLTLQTHLEQSQMIVPLLLMSLKPLQLLAGLDGEGGVRGGLGGDCLPAHDETPPVPGRAVHHGPRLGPQCGPVALQLQDWPWLGNCQQVPLFS